MAWFVWLARVLCLSIVFWLFLIVSTSAIGCLGRLVSEMTCYVLTGMLNPVNPVRHIYRSMHYPGQRTYIRPGTAGSSDIHRVSKKTLQNCFRQNFVKCPPILIIFGRKMAKRLELCEMYSFSTSPNLRHHTDKYYQNWCKFDKVLTKTNLQFFETWCIYTKPDCKCSRKQQKRIVWYHVLSWCRCGLRAGMSFE